ncbi:hypothetical protein [Lentzea sp. NPDC004782]|uniref:hypothetical protein n=1 Tax=Lentzea sp. NPDC004782 TaxID=3154458 RepID=UPI0033B9621C
MAPPLREAVGVAEAGDGDAQAARGLRFGVLPFSEVAGVVTDADNAIVRWKCRSSKPETAVSSNAAEYR